jgi:hypothetical protein
MRILVERPIGAPARERPGRPTIPFVRAVTGLLAGQIEPHDIGRMTRQQAFLLGAPDDVVGGRQDQPLVGHGRGVVAQGAERTDVGHGTSPQTGMTGGSRDDPIVR